MTSPNGHNPDDMPDIREELEQQQEQHRERLRVGISDALALEQASGLGYSFNALQIMARMSFDPEQWMGLTEVTEREIQIQCLRYARRHRARYGNSRLDLVDWKKAMLRVSKNREGRRELERMFIAEKGRQQAERDFRTPVERMMGARPLERDPMKLAA
jgi:hypothetical protein